METASKVTTSGRKGQSEPQKRVAWKDKLSRYSTQAVPVNIKAVD